MGRAGGERRSRERAGNGEPKKNPLALILFLPKYVVENPKHQHLGEELRAPNLGRASVEHSQ